MAKGMAGGLQRLMHYFLPREEEFFGLFAEMSRHAHSGAQLLEEVFANYPSVEQAVAGITDLEHTVDNLRHDCVRRLHDTFVTPIMFDRQDIFDLAEVLDDVLDFTRAAADRTVFYQVESIPPAVQELAALLTESTAELSQACAQLEHLGPKDCVFVHRVNEIENQADVVLKQGLANLFRHSTSAVEVIKWKEIYDYVEEAIDHCEDVVNMIEACWVKNS